MGRQIEQERLLRAFRKENSKIRVIHHEKNRGYGAALKSGFYNAKKPWVTFTDADGQFDFSELSDFINTQKESGADMVLGYYRKRAVSTFRKLGSFVWQMIMFGLFRFRVHDIDCGFKLIKRDVIGKIPRLEAERGALISTELLVKAKRAGFSWVQIPVSHYPRDGGEATGSSVKVIANSFYDLFRLWRKLR